MKKGCLIILLIGAALVIFAVLFGPKATPPSKAEPQLNRQAAAEPTPQAIAAPTPPPFPAREFWPREIATTTEQVFLGSLGGNEIKTKIPSGTKVEISDVEDQKWIISRRGELTARIPLEETDFLVIGLKAQSTILAAREKEKQEAVAKENAEEVARAAAAAQDQAERGREPLWGESITGKLQVPRSVVRSIKASLKDPDSFQVRKLISILPAEKDGRKCYQLIFEFASKNGFGGYVPAAAVAYVHESEVIDLVIHKD